MSSKETGKMARALRVKGRLPKSSNEAHKRGLRMKGELVPKGRDRFPLGKYNLPDEFLTMDLAEFRRLVRGGKPVRGTLH